MNEKPTILIVDDDTGLREVLKMLLLTQGYRVIEAEDGPQALELAQKHIPDLVLLDIMMPGMDGFEVCRRLRADPVLDQVPIMIITALDDRESRIAGIEAGADDFITKPYDRVELRARVRTVTRLNRYHSLLAERARFVWVIDNEQDGYLMLDEQGDLHYANAAARKLFNLPGEEENFPSASFLEFIGSSFLRIPPARWNDWLSPNQDGEPLYLVRPQTESSQATWYELRVLDLPWGNRKRILLRVQDVSETVAMKVETWSFQTAANHKLKTPIANILMALQIMSRMARGSAAPELVEMIESTERAARRLESEIKDVLEYIYAPRIADTGEYFQLEQLQPLLGQIAAQLSIEKPRLIAEDSGLLKKRVRLSNQAMQVLMWETLENAKKFHPRFYPHVEVCLSCPAPEALTIQIKDNGVTLSPKEMAQALTPYYQSEKSYSGEVAGMGLGLSTVAALVWQVGGSIALYNRSQGPGVVVEIRVPVVEQESA